MQAGCLWGLGGYLSPRIIQVLTVTPSVCPIRQVGFFRVKIGLDSFFVVSVSNPPRPTNKRI